MNLVSSLIDHLGLTENHIYEVVLSTYGREGRPHAAPMGMTFRQPREIIIRPFKTSLTYNNLCESRCGVVNITSDPELFYRTAFKETLPSGESPQEWFETAKKVKAPRLKLAPYHIEFVVKWIGEESRERAIISCEVKGFKGEKIFSRPYCRAAFASIECIIHATRIKEYLSRGWVETAEELIRLVNNYRSLCERVAPHSKYTKIVDELLAFIEIWRQQAKVG